jgi:hypothetical protein
MQDPGDLDIWPEQQSHTRTYKRLPQASPPAPTGDTDGWQNNTAHEPVGAPCELGPTACSGIDELQVEALARGGLHSSRNSSGGLRGAHGSQDCKEGDLGGCEHSGQRDAQSMRVPRGGGKGWVPSPAHGQRHILTHTSVETMSKSFVAPPPPSPPPGPLQPPLPWQERQTCRTTLW